MFFSSHFELRGHSAPLLLAGAETLWGEGGARTVGSFLCQVYDLKHSNDRRIARNVQRDFSCFFYSAILFLLSAARESGVSQAHSHDGTML